MAAGEWDKFILQQVTSEKFESSDQDELSKLFSPHIDTNERSKTLIDSSKGVLRLRDMLVMIMSKPDTPKELMNLDFYNYQDSHTLPRKLGTMSSSFLNAVCLSCFVHTLNLPRVTHLLGELLFTHFGKIQTLR